MKNYLAIVLLLVCGLIASAQEPLVQRSTKSYLITDYNAKDTAFLDFIPITPFTIKARFGYWTKKGQLSFEPAKTDEQIKKQ